MPMKFTIADLLWTTTAAAMLFALLRFGIGGLFAAFVILNFMQILFPFAIIFATIVFADQRGQTLDFTTLAGWRAIKKLWCLSLACTVIVWILFFAFFLL
ncbi:hypothetical protein SH449x_002830 [Pirellulaceae bacterium SH449]